MRSLVDWTEFFFGGFWDNTVAMAIEAARQKKVNLKSEGKAEKEWKKDIQCCYLVTQW